MSITAIPTTYANGHYRSRLEARWAAFFDLVGLPYIYEPIDAGGYIPDFLIPGANPLYVEVGPVSTLEEYQEKATKGLLALARGDMNGDLLVVGVDPVGRGMGARGGGYHDAYIGLHWQRFGPYHVNDVGEGEGLVIESGRLLYRSYSPYTNTTEDSIPQRFGNPAVIGRCTSHEKHDGNNGCGIGYVMNTLMSFTKNPCGDYEGGGWTGELDIPTIERRWREAGALTQWKPR